MTDSRVFAVYYHPDGRYWFSCCEHNDWDFSSQGTWKIAGNELCSVRNRDGRKRCFTYFLDGKKLLTDTTEIYRFEK